MIGWASRVSALCARVVATTDESERHARLDLAVILIAAAVLRFMTPLGANGLGTMEYDQVLLAGPMELNLPWLKVLIQIHHGPVTPGLLKAWMAMGPFFGGDAGLRLLSALVSLIAVWVTYETARATVGRWAARFSAGFIAVNLLFLEFSRDARLYPLHLLAALLVVLVTLLALERGSVALAAAAAILVPVAVLNHIMAAPFVASLFAGVLFARRASPSNRRRTAAGLALGGLAAFPWLMLHAMAAKGGDPSLALHTGAWWFEAYNLFCNGPFLPFLLLFLWWRERGPAGPDAVRCADAPRIFAITALGGILAVDITSLLVFPVCKIEYLLPALPAVAVLTGAFGQRRSGFARLTLMTVCVLAPAAFMVGAACAGRPLSTALRERGDTRVVVERARAAGAPPDVIAMPGYKHALVRRYWPGASVVEDREANRDDASAPDGITVLYWPWECGMKANRETCDLARSVLYWRYRDPVLLYRDAKAEAWTFRKR